MPSGSPTERKRTADRLVIGESQHEAAEEAVFWPLVRDWVEGGAALAWPRKPRNRAPSGC
jgi:hypothetical protein